MSLTQRVIDLTNRIAAEFKMVREEMTQALSAGGPAGGVLGGTYPDPEFADDVVFEGRGIMDGLIVTDGLDLRGVNNKMSVGSVVTLHDKTSGATNPPVLTVDHEVVNVLSEYLFRPNGMYLDSTEADRHYMSRFLQFSQIVNNNKRVDIPLRGPMEGGGADQAEFKAYSMTRIQNATGPRTIGWGEELKQNVPGQPTQWRMDGIYLRAYDDAPMLSDLPPVQTVTSLKTNAFNFFFQHAVGRCFSVSGAARAGEFCSIRVEIGASLGTFQRWTCEDAAGFVAVQTVTNVSMPYITSANGNGIRGVAFGSSTRMGFHGTNQDVWVVFTKDWAYVYNAAATARITDLEFPTVSDQNHFAIGNLAPNDFAGFRAIPYSDQIPLTRYTDISWTDTDSSIWWAGHTWYDSVGTTHETNMSVPASITMVKRARLLVSSGPLPDPAAGAGQPRAADDVNSFRLYLQRGAAQPPSTAFVRQTTQPAALATSIAVTTLPLFSGAGLAPPVATNFPGAGPATLQSSAIAADGTPKFRMRADGTAEFETIDVGGPMVTGLTGRTFDQLFYRQRAQDMLTGGGKRTATGGDPANIIWNSRFLVLGHGRGTSTATSGYFEINVPSGGTVITGYGGAANKTVVASGIPLAAYETLWYELPFGSGSASMAGNFRVSSYTSDFLVPNNWVMIARHVSEGGTFHIHWGDGIRTGVPGFYDVTAAPVPGRVIVRYTEGLQPANNIPNNGADWLAYQPPQYTVPAGARTCHALIQTKGRWTGNAACYWYLSHAGTGNVAIGRIHNSSDPGNTADMALFAVINVNPGDNFNCNVACNNDVGSVSWLTLIPSYYTFTFMS